MRKNQKVVSIYKPTGQKVVRSRTTMTEDDYRAQLRAEADSWRRQCLSAYSRLSAVERAFDTALALAYSAAKAATETGSSVVPPDHNPGEWN